jgi:diguanylate cyclase (GGDEF)-like protein
VLLAACLLVGAADLVRAEEMLFTRLGPEAGLSQGAVLAIRQDRAGFMWFGTEDGLIRYDGSDLRHVVRDRKDPTSLPNNWVSAIALEPRSGRVFVGTEGGGLAVRDPQDGRFHAPTDAAGRPLVDAEARVRTLAFDRRGRLWVGTRGAGAAVVDLESRTVRMLVPDPASAASLSDGAVFQFVEDGDAMWVATQAGLDRVGSDGRIERFGPALASALHVDGGVKVNALVCDDRGALWIGTDLGLVRRDPGTGALRVLKHSSDDPASLADDRVQVLLEDTEQRLWVGTVGGLGLLDRRTLKFESFRHDAADASTLPDSNVVSLYEDASGLLWVGTKTGGIARWNPRSWSFGHRRLPGASPGTTSFAVDARGTLWIGTFGDGLFGFDRRTGDVRRYGRAGTGGLGDDNVMALAVDARDRLWIGTMRAGVVRLDPATGRLDRFLPDPATPAALPVPGVMSLLPDSHGNVWVGTFGGGLARIDGTRDVVTRFPTARDGRPGLSAERATALAEDRSGLIWIGTDGGGLDVLDPVTGTFRHYDHANSDPHSLSAHTVYALHVDVQGRVWIGTRGGGLDLATGAPLSQPGLKFENLSEADGLPNSTVYGIESDLAGRLWLSTNRGVVSYDPRSRRIQGFRRSHGLQGDEFNFGAHYRSAAGEMFFGGSNGYNAFFPERLRFNDRPPPVVLTDVLKLNAPLGGRTPPDALTEAHFGYRDSVLTFKFAALDFTAPSENRYQYRLDGFDSEWVDAGQNRQVTYTNLAGGRYAFHVRAANSDGAWSGDHVALRIVIDPPPWATWWAYALYTILFGLALAAVWASQQRRVHREAGFKVRLQQEVDARTAELALRNEQLETANRQLQEASVTDPLTGLGNRRALHDTVASMLAVAARTGQGGAPGPRFVLMVIDLDRLKPINDQYGHEAGDRVLKQVAETLRGVSRASDRVVRWGGDEFVVLCRDADLALAGALAERFRSALAKQIFRIGDGAVARTSCSIGFAPYPFVPHVAGSLDWEDSLALADGALYEAKRTRNTWVGWCGTLKTLQVENLLQAVEQDPQALEAGGYLEVRRRTSSFEDTVDSMLAFKGPGDR